MPHSQPFRAWMNRDRPFISADDYLRYLSAVGTFTGRNVFDTIDANDLNKFEQDIMANPTIMANTKGNYNSALNKYREYAQTVRDEQEIPDFSRIFSYEFTSESFGTGRRKVKKSTFERNHGLVVNALEKILRLKGYKTANDRNIDLFTYEDNKVEKLFEVKRSSSTQSLYSAVGQLIIYSIPIENKVDLILVMPSKLKESVVNRLTEFGIKILYYDFNGGDPKFKEIDTVL